MRLSQAETVSRDLWKSAHSPRISNGTNGLNLAECENFPILGVSPVRLACLALPGALVSVLFSIIYSYQGKSKRTTKYSCSAQKLLACCAEAIQPLIEGSGDGSW